MASWSVIVGATGTNKGRVALRVARTLAQRGLRVAGFVQEEVSDAAGEPLGWDVVSVTDESRCILARRADDDTLCGYRFEDSGFDQARRWAMAPSDVVIIGAVGKLEAAQRGNWAVLEALVRDAKAPHAVACIRDSSLSTVALSLPDPEAYVELPCTDAALDDFVKAVQSAASAQRS